MIVGFTGPMRAGKSTAAMHLVVRYGYVKMSIAGPVKRDCAHMLEMVGVAPRSQIEEEMRSTITKEQYRGLLQWYGVFRRERDPDHWVRLLRSRLDMVSERGMDVVIDDVRFLNEAAMIRELGGRIVCIESTRAGISDHASEREWPRIAVDAVLWNDGSVAALHRNIDEEMAAWTV